MWERVVHAGISGHPEKAEQGRTVREEWEASLDSQVWQDGGS